MRVSFVRVPWADSQPRRLALQRKGSSQNTTLAAGEWNRQVRAHVWPDDPDSSSA